LAASASKRFAQWLLFAFASGCSSRALEPEGEYSTERTVVTTGIGATDNDGCGAPQAPQSGEPALRYRVSRSGGSLEVTEVAGGCLLDARFDDGVVVADGAECSLLADAPLTQLGVISRSYSVFRLDPRSSTVRTRSVTQATVVGGETRSCSVSEERIVGARALAGERYRYSGSFVTTVEQPASRQNCGGEDLRYQASGYLNLNRSARLVRLEGFGCTLRVGEKTGTSFAGSSQDCVPDGAVGFSGFGLDALRLDTITIDPDAETIVWQARAWRSLPSGRVSYCFELNGTLEPS
jgi:hypothetical protein